MELYCFHLKQFRIFGNFLVYCGLCCFVKFVETIIYIIWTCILYDLKCLYQENNLLKDLNCQKNHFQLFHLLNFSLVVQENLIFFGVFKGSKSIQLSFLNILDLFNQTNLLLAQHEQNPVQNESIKNIIFYFSNFRFFVQNRKLT